MRRNERFGWIILLACAGLAACATTPPAQPPRPLPRPPVPAPEALSWRDLPGWAEEDHLGALRAVDAACRMRSRPEGPCAELFLTRPTTDAQAKAYFEAEFRLEPLAGQGLLTAYFSPEYEARAAPDAEFSAALRPKPADPAKAALDRAAIEALPPDDALAWMRPEELFFLQIQGSGSLAFPDGRRLKASVAATNGLPFTAIARPMLQQGLIAEGSGETIRAWLAAHRGPEADQMMRLNPRYVFFALQPDDGRDPPGAAGIALPAGRAVAVDPQSHAFGELIWIDAQAPGGGFPGFRRLTAALDIGGAIKGEVRADLYLGRGAEAGVAAGRVRHALNMVRLVPRAAP